MKLIDIGEATPTKKIYERPIIETNQILLEYSVAAGSVQSNVQQESSVENRNIDVEW